jgi:hypothetical protein
MAFISVKSRHLAVDQYHPVHALYAWGYPSRHVYAADRRELLTYSLNIWICTPSTYPDYKLSDLQGGRGGTSIWICTP